jgi:SepF-like predicted cell division protein (DUF552 family)
VTRKTVPTARLRARLDALGFGVDASGTTTVRSDLDRTLDLAAVADGLTLAEVVYEPDQFPGVIYRPDDAAAVAVLFDDGTLFVESADGFGELLVEITDGLDDLGMGGDVNPLRADFVVSPDEVPVPSAFADEVGTETSVYPDAGPDVPSSGDADTKIYQTDETDSPAHGTGEAGSDGSAAGTTADEHDTAASTASQGSRVHVATVSEKRDAMVIIDAIYDGDLVIADITRHNTADGTVEKIVDSLRQVTEDVGGDIVQKGEDELILAPGGMEIAREKLT